VQLPSKVGRNDDTRYVVNLSRGRSMLPNRKRSASQTAGVRLHFLR